MLLVKNCQDFGNIPEEALDTLYNMKYTKMTHDYRSIYYYIIISMHMYMYILLYLTECNKAFKRMTSYYTISKSYIHTIMQ